MVGKMVVTVGKMVVTVEKTVVTVGKVVVAVGKVVVAVGKVVVKISSIDEENSTSLGSDLWISFGLLPKAKDEGVMWISLRSWVAVCVLAARRINLVGCQEGMGTILFLS
ncbi:hypothetical protein Tco_1176612 [Tanacetum coccineum]